MSAIEITLFAKADGALSKRISLAADGVLQIDGSECCMARGVAKRCRLDSIAELAKLIKGLPSNQAIALGALRPGLPDEVCVVTKNKLNGAANVIARTADYITAPAARAGLVLLDFDAKGMPANVAARIAKLGGAWPALVSVLPALRNAARVVRSSTSAGLSRMDTGERMPGSNGLHVYIAAADGADAERFLKTLHDRCWLVGLGWLMVGAGGQLLDRSIVDRMVGRPERLVFEGAPVVVAPLLQDEQSRQPAIFEGDTLDTLAACPHLNILEKTRLAKLKAIDAQQLAPESAKVRTAFVAEHAAQLASSTGMSPAAAAHVAGRHCDGVLLPDVVLPFDDADFAGKTVADVLADPDRFEGATLADPLEGVAYGICKARVMRRADGTVWINSFAHGRTVYELRPDAHAVLTAMKAAPADEVIETFIRLALAADLAEGEIEELRDIAAKRSGISKRTILNTLKTAQERRAQQRKDEDHQRRLAQRHDTRPQIPAPAPDAPWVPEMNTLNEVLSRSAALEPPARNVDGVITQSRKRRIPGMHAYVHRRDDEPELPAPEQWLLTRLDEMQLAELIEHHIEYTDKKGRPVHLAPPFVRHYLQRLDDALPTVVAIATLPIVLADGELLAQHGGLDRSRGIVFHIPKELMKLLPRRKDCTPEAVAAAMRFLCDDWLCDVATDHTGKCTLMRIAAILLLGPALKRLALPCRSRHRQRSWPAARHVEGRGTSPASRARQTPTFAGGYWLR